MASPCQAAPARAVVTGMNGTVAPAVARVLERAGTAVVPWNRTLVPPDDRDAMEQFLRREKPDWLLHIATGPAEWAGDLARLARELEIRFLFTGSVSVFAGRAPGDNRGPYRPDADEPDATDDYGRYKADCERRVRDGCPEALIARLGWQIGETPGGNTMLEFLCRTARENGGRIEASRRWFPSCAFLSDTAEALVQLLGCPERYPAGTCHLNGNPAYSFYEIAVALRSLHRAPWTLVPADEFARDDRMTDPRAPMRPISERLQLPER